MADPRKIVLVSTQGYRRELDTLVAGWIEVGVKYLGVVGVDSSNLENVIDDLCIGVGTDPYFMLTASHGDDETVGDAISLAKQLTEGVGNGPVEVVEL
jgi:hypothetical protein